MRGYMERRRFMRIPIISDVEVKTGDKDFSGVVINVSAGGIGIVSDKPFELGIIVEASFKLGSDKFEKVRGTITRSDTIVFGKYFLVGMNFISLNGSQKTDLDRYIQASRISRFSSSPKHVTGGFLK
jgi:c-di-GMP-binding flagellar brake protein YcgR